jgi:hypothetical protein
MEGIQDLSVGAGQDDLIAFQFEERPEEPSHLSVVVYNHDLAHDTLPSFASAFLESAV